MQQNIYSENGHKLRIIFLHTVALQKTHHDQIPTLECIRDELKPSTFKHFR